MAEARVYRIIRELEPHQRPERFSLVVFEAEPITSSALLSKYIAQCARVMGAR